VKIDAKLIVAMVEAGVTAEQIALIAAKYDDASAESDAEKRERARIRQQNHRARNAVSRVTDVTCVTKEGSPHTPLQENPTPKEKPLRVKKKGVSPLPEGFKPDIEFAISRGLKRSTAELQAEKFVNYWQAAKDGLKADWPATWRTWVLGHIERNGTDGAAPAQTGPATPEQWQKRLSYARQQSTWAKAEWGPPPGSSGCLVPPELLKPGDGDGWLEWKQQAA
jgi:hypothetical protein